MSADSGDLRQQAEDRVRLRFDRQTAALAEWQREERERDARLQTRAVSDSIAHQALLEHDKEQTLAEHKKAWDQAKVRLTPRPVPAPAYDMIGTPPNRNVVQHHDEMLQRWTERRDQMAKGFDQSIAACEATRAEMLEGFGRANQARDQAHREDRLDLGRRQEESDERLVSKELHRADKWISREFHQRSRDDNQRDL